MNQKALALLVTMMVCMPSAAYAARAYDGQPLATKNGPAYEPQTVDDVARRAAQAEAIRKLQDEPDQFAEEAVQAKQESEKEKKARQERERTKRPVSPICLSPFMGIMSCTTPIQGNLQPAAMCASIRARSGFIRRKPGAMLLQAMCTCSKGAA